MGYDVHMVRTEYWFDSHKVPITKADVDRLIASDPTLSWSTSDYIDMSDADGAVSRYFLINWNGAPVFWWYLSEIRCRSPGDAQLLKMIEMAKALGARVVGDDDESYERGRTLFGKAKIVVHRA